MDSSLKRICEIFKEEDNFLIAAHYNPDGDALGSSAALAFILKALGKRVRIYNHTGVPANMDWFELPVPMLTEIPQGYDGWVVALDCGDAARMGEPLMNFIDRDRSINIDHHIGNTQFAGINWVETNRPAVGEMIAIVAQHLGMSLSGKLGECLYLAIATDTGFFTYGNTKPETLEIIAEILRHGLKLDEFVPQIRNNWTIKRVRLWNIALDKIELYHDEQTALIFITQEMLEKTDTNKSDCEEMVNFIRRIKSVRVSAIIREDGPLRYKFSLRSQGADNVQAVASLFGGGGHKNASGGLIEDNPDTVRRKLIDAIGEHIGLV